MTCVQQAHGVQRSKIIEKRDGGLQRREMDRQRQRQIYRRGKQRDRREVKKEREREGERY